MNQQNQEGQEFQNAQEFQPAQESQMYNQPAEFVQSEAPAPESVVSAEPVAAPRKSKKPLVFIIIAAAVLTLGLIIGGFFGFRALFGDKAGGNTIDIAGGGANGSVKGIDESLLSTIELYPDCEVNKEELEGFATLIAERVSILGKEYEVVCYEDKIVLVIKKSLLGETAAERTSTIELLTSRGNISFGLDEYTSYKSPQKNNISEITLKEFNRMEILKDYRLNFVDERYAQLDALNKETIYGVELKLTEEGAVALEEVIDSSYIGNSSKITLMHDFLEDDVYANIDFMGTVLMPTANDESLVYVISSGCTYDKNAAVLKKVLEQKSYDFGLVIEIADEPLWEVEGKYMGKNQKTEMSGKTVVAEFSPEDYYRSNRTEVDFAEYEAEIKNRLDVLNIDYMFGTTGFDDKTYCIKVKPEDFSPDFFRLIFGYHSISTYSAFDLVGSFSSPEVVEVDGKYVLRLDSYRTTEELLDEYEIPGNIIYLVVNDVTIASADVSQIQPDSDGSGNYLDFSNFLCFGDIEVSSSEKNILDLIVAIDDGYYSSFEGTFRFRGFDGNKEISTDDMDWKYEILSGEDMKVFNIVEELGYTAQKKVDKRNMLIITLDVPVNEDLPRNFLNEVKTVYEACGFDAGAYNEIHFVIKDESKESPADKCRITARKDTYDGRMELFDTVSGPKFSEYWMEFYDIMGEEDTFYMERN